MGDEESSFGRDNEALFDEEPSFSHFATSTPRKQHQHQQRDALSTTAAGQRLHESDTDDLKGGARLSFSRWTQQQPVQTATSSGSGSGASTNTLVESVAPSDHRPDVKGKRRAAPAHQYTVTEQDPSSSSSSSARERLNKRPSPSRDINDFIENTLKTPAKLKALQATISHDSNPATPHAPGAFPAGVGPSTAQARRLAANRQALSASQRMHDAFERHITGPDGALAHSAERRAKAALSTPSPRAAAPTADTPHPVGWYPPTPLARYSSKEPRHANDVEDDDYSEEREEKALLARKLREMSARQRATETRVSTYKYKHYDGDADSSSPSPSEQDEAPITASKTKKSQIASNRYALTPLRDDEKSQIRFAMADSPAPASTSKTGHSSRPSRRTETRRSPPVTRSPSPPLPPPLLTDASPPRTRRTRVPQTSPRVSRSPPVPPPGEPIAAELEGETADRSHSLEEEDVTFLRTVLPELRTIVERMKEPPSTSLDERGLPVRPTEAQPMSMSTERETIAELMKRRKKESDHRARMLEEAHEQKDHVVSSRNQIEQKTLEKDLRARQAEESNLLAKLDELSSSISDLGPLLATTVDEARLSLKRPLLFFLLAQLGLALLMVRFSNARAERMYRHMTVDPFYVFEGWTLLLDDTNRVVSEDTMRVFGLAAS